jgi:hypothetical protein
LISVIEVEYQRARFMLIPRVSDVLALSYRLLLLL